MATSTDPLQRDRIGIVSQDTGERYQAQRSNSALRLAAALKDIAPDVAQVGSQLAAQEQDKQEAKAKAAAIEASGADLADAVRLGKIKPTQNPWFISAYHRESAAIRGQDALSKLSTDSASWEERADPAAFAKRWHSEVGNLMGQFGGDPDTIKGFTAAEGQATQQALASNQAYNVQRIQNEREQNLSTLAATALAQAVQAGGGHISGSGAAEALEPAKRQWIATGGSLDKWNEMQAKAVTTASYYIRSPGLIDLLKAPELLQGPRPDDTSQYGDGVEAEATDPNDRSTWAPRPDGSAKGTGFLGVIKRPDGSVSSEISVGLPINGKEMDVPTMVPGLTKDEVNWLLTTPVDQVAKNLPASIREKAIANAKDRIAKGLSPFKQDNEGAGPLVSPGNGPRLQPPVPGRITNTFAQHEARGSHGVDIAAPTGTKVVTPIGGRAEVGHDDRSGLFVRVVSPDGKVISSYAHLFSASVQNGQHIGPGESVGLVGQTGHATGPHVHWRLKVDGRDVDPLSYHPGEQQAQAAPAAAGEEAPQLQAPQAPQHGAPITVLGNSLYGMAGVADAAESDRYRIRSSLNSEATDRLQAITAQRRLQGIAATDALYAAYGTRVLSGDVTPTEIVNSLSKAGYTPQVIAEAMNNVHAAVGDTAGLSTARLTLNGADPQQGAKVFALATEGRTKGYTEDYENRVAQAILNGDISSSDGISMVGSAVSRSESIASANRAEINFNLAHGGTPGDIITSAGKVNSGIDAFVGLASAKARQLGAKPISQAQTTYMKGQMRQAVNAYLATHPGDWAGGEQAARDWVAAFLRSLLAQRTHATPTASTPTPASGGNPRR